MRALLEQGETVRGLVLPGDHTGALAGLGVELVEGDVCDGAALDALLAEAESRDVYLIHTAGIISISTRHPERIREVNVDGTRNVIAKCQQHAVRRLVYISSVHAIPERADRAITEVDAFTADSVRGLYAKTKAEASQLVLDAARDGLDAIILHPSGILGPGDYGRGHGTQLMIDYLNGSLLAGVQGGYDFVDVRDVAAGVVAAAQAGERGQCYILSNRYISVRELFDLISEFSHVRNVKLTLPLWLAKAFAPFAEVYYRLRRQPPLFTSYSLSAISSHTTFSFAKATAAFGYQPRSLRETIRDTVQWLCHSGRAKANPLSGPNHPPAGNAES